MFGHHIWCNFSSPRNDPATCRQCKRLNAEYPEQEGMMEKYFPDAIVKEPVKKEAGAQCQHIGAIIVEPATIQQRTPTTMVTISLPTSTPLATSSKKSKK